MHSLNCILIYIVILLTIGLLPNAFFWSFFLIVCLVAFYLQNQAFLKRLLKLKWLFLTVLLVSAYATPGEYFSSESAQYLPTKEGVILGVEQAAKIIIAIASLSILLYEKDVQSLIQGVYFLLLPLKYFKININQFSMRLLLTLNYVNAITASNSKKMRFSEIYQAIQMPPSQDDLKFVQLSMTPFSIHDYFMLGFICLYLSLIFKFLL